MNIKGVKGLAEEHKDL